MFKPSFKHMSIAAILAPLMAAGSAMAQAVDAAAAASAPVVAAAAAAGTVNHGRQHQRSVDGRAARRAVGASLA